MITAHHFQTSFLLPILSILILITPQTDGAPTGICYGRVSDNLPPPAAVVTLLQSNGITRARIFDTDSGILRSFAGSGIELMIGVPNEDLPSLANSAVDFSLQWLHRNIFAHISPEQIRYLAVGNEVFVKDPYYMPFVIPAIINLHQALQTLNLHETIKLSTPHAACVLQSSYPPSNGTFVPDLQPAMAALLQFLLVYTNPQILGQNYPHQFLNFAFQETNSPLMVNVYPFFSYAYNTKAIPLDYALFKSPNIVLDRGLLYSNLFDATIDSFVAAMEKVGFEGVSVLVAETGWPKDGGDAATAENALAYNQNVIRRARDNAGTPRRPGIGIEVFVFDLFDEDRKGGEEYERHFGVFEINGGKSYDVSFT